MPPSRKARVTIASVDALGPDEILWDTDLKGFGVRRQARAVSYIVKTRVHGRQRWLTTCGLPHIHFHRLYRARS